MKQIIFFLSILLFLYTNNAFSFCMRDPFTGNVICPPEPPTPTMSIDRSLSPRETVPSPPSSSSSRGSGGGFSPSQQMQLMMIKGVLQPLLNSLFQPTIPNTYQGPSPEELKRMKEEQLKKEAQERFELLHNWQLIRQKSSNNVKDRNKNISSLLAVDVTPVPENKPLEIPSGTPFFNDATSVFGNLVMDKSIEKIEDIGKEVIDKLGEKYKKEWGSKLYEKGLPILKIAVTAGIEGKEEAGIEAVNYTFSLLSKPMTSIQTTVADIGRAVYKKIANYSLDLFLEETEKAGKVLGFEFSKDDFKQEFEDSMTTIQKIIYKY